MLDQVQPPPDPGDRPPTPSWPRRRCRSASHRDRACALADVLRRALSALFGLRWRLRVSVLIRTEVTAPDKDSAADAVAAALRHPDTIVALSRADPDTVPPWRPLGRAEHVEPYTDVWATANGAGTWQAFTHLTAAFSVDADEAGWPYCCYAVDVVPADRDGRLHDTDTSLLITRRRPTRPDASGARRTPRRSRP